MQRDTLIIYPVHNRAYYTAISAPYMLEEAQHPSVAGVFVADDSSNAATTRVLTALRRQFEGEWIDRVLLPAYAHSSTGALRYAIEYLLDESIQFVCKIDNDILVPRGYLGHLRNLMDRHHDIGFLGMVETSGLPVLDAADALRDGPHIGGVGLFRTAALTVAPILPYKRFFGFTELQMKARQLGWRCCWTTGSMNTTLDTSPWSCLDAYVEQNVCRHIGGPKRLQHWERSPIEGD